MSSEGSLAAPHCERNKQCYKIIDSYDFVVIGSVMKIDCFAVPDY